jgi:peptide/nickel transport system substrate-binding protein
MQINNELVVGTWQEPDNLNAYFTWTASGVWFGMLALESVLRPDGHGSFVPVLTQRVPLVANGDVEGDGIRLTYRLKPDVRWADGRPFGSHDLQFTWEALADPVNEVISREGFEHVTSIDTPDERTAVLHLRRPYAAYPLLYMAVFPKHLCPTTNMNHASVNETPVGTGPYFVEAWQRGHAILYRRNPYYRGPGPYFDRLCLRLFRTQDDLVAALLAKEVDLALNLGVHHLQLLRERPDLKVAQLPSAHIERITYNLRDPLLSDRRLRLALDYAIDREALVRDAGQGVLALAGSELDGSPWATPFPRRSYDLREAEALLDAAGWARGADGMRVKNGTRLTLTLLAPEGDNLRERLMPRLTAMLTAVGIALEVHVYPTKQYFAMVSGQGPLTAGRFQLALSNLGMFGDPEPHYSVRFHSELIPGPQNNYVGGNFGAYHNPDVDRWLDQASETLDPEKRRALYAKVEATIHDDCPVSYLYRRPIIDAWRHDLVGLEYLPYRSVWCLTWSANQWRLAALTPHTPIEHEGV